MHVIKQAGKNNPQGQAEPFSEIMPKKFVFISKAHKFNALLIVTGLAVCVNVRQRLLHNKSSPEWLCWAGEVIGRSISLQGNFYKKKHKAISPPPSLAMSAI